MIDFDDMELDGVTMPRQARRLQALNVTIRCDDGQFVADVEKTARAPAIDLQGCQPMGYPAKSPPEEIREQVARLAAWLAEMREAEPTETESAVHRALMRGR